jgi:glyoxylase-like metal-dependent hydrolase (beta-lactamase superfamily II)
MLKGAVSMTQVIPIHLQMSNAYLVVGEKAILVDTGSPNKTRNLVNVMHEKGLDVRDLSLIIHTHAHYDHCGCTAELKQISDVPIAIHKVEAETLREGVNAPIVPTNGAARLMMPFVKKSYEGVGADIWVEDEMDLRSYGVDGQVIHTPGHTPGSISVVTEDGKAIVGDIVGGGLLIGVLFRQRPRYHYFATDVSMVRSSIKRLMGLSLSRVYVGHGGPLEMSAVRKWFSREIGC